MPRVFVLLTLLLLGLAGGAPLLSPGPEACAVSCADEDDHGQCPTDCADCACCARHPTPVVARVSTALEGVDPAQPRPQGPASRALAGVGRKILHVPIGRDS